MKDFGAGKISGCEQAIERILGARKCRDFELPKVQMYCLGIPGASVS